MENGNIPNENIKTSHVGRDPWEARLNGPKFWACSGDIVAPWIQADIGYQTYVSGVITQGGGGDMRTNGKRWINGRLGYLVESVYLHNEH